MADRKIILAIDDISENLIKVRSMLEGYFDIRLSNSGKMALNLLENISVDLILLDIEMPLMSGFDFLKELRSTNSKNKETPVIIVTTHAGANFINKAINAGAKDYLLKPLIAEALYKKIDSLIGMPTDKTLLNPTEEKAQQLLSVLAVGDTMRIDIVLAELVNIVRGQNINIRRFVEDIGLLISNCNYEKTISKTREFLVYLSINKKNNVVNSLQSQKVVT